MYNTVVNPNEISQCQNELEKALKKHLTHSGGFNLGFPGGSWDVTINYNDYIWFYNKEIGKDSKSPRYWNGFGLAETLSDKNSNNIVVEINIPTTGINRKVAGFYARDDNGNICLFHRGRIGGGRPGINKTAFLNWSSYKLTDVITLNRKESAILVGDVAGNDFVANLHKFVITIEHFKAAVTSGKIDELTLLSDDELLKIIDSERPKLKSPVKTETLTASYQRSLHVKEYALRRANGKCQLCLNEAPFCSAEGKPYLEVHHVIWLSNEGSDTPENVVALCPNCHRKMHIVNGKSDIDILLNKAKLKKVP